MNIITRMLRQTATYWGNPVPDGAGGFTFDAPRTIPCRWVDVMENVVDSSGDSFTSHAKVYVGEDLELGGYLALGDFTEDSSSSSTTTTTTNTTTTEEQEPDFTPDASAHRIRMRKNMPNLRATEFLRIVWL